jgi:uncharacterized protein (TIGR02452 family)
VLATAEQHGHRVLVLGAWGCGAFGNDATLVADAFAAWLEGPRFRGCFEHVVFAVWDPRPGRPVLGAFQLRFGR